MSGGVRDARYGDRIDEIDDSKYADLDDQDRIGLAQDHLKRQQRQLFEIIGVNSQYIQKLQDDFETERRAIGPAQQIRAEICASSKEMISALTGSEDLEKKLQTLGRLLDILPKLPISTRLCDELEKDSSQELTEAAIIIRVFPALTGKDLVANIIFPTHSDLGVPPTSWLAGVGDAAGEISKIVYALELGGFGEDSEKLFTNALYIIKELGNILHNFSRTYRLVLNNTWRREQGFSSKVRLAQMAALRMAQELVHIRRHKRLEKMINNLTKRINP